MIAQLMRRGCQGGGRIPSVSLLLGSLAVPAFLLSWCGTALEYSRQALAGGEFWRLVTCHWTHFSSDVFLWDLVAFVFLGAACERRDRQSYLVCLGAAAFLIPAVIWIFMPGLDFYRGLSGLDSALFGLLTVTLLREGIESGDRRRIVSVAFFTLFFLGKVTWETVGGGAVFAASTGTGVVPIPLAHAVGLAIGIATGLKMKVPGRRLRGLPSSPRTGEPGFMRSSRPLRKGGR